MKTADAISAFSSVRDLAAGLGITVQAVYAWGEDVPALRVYQIRDLLAAKQPITTETEKAA